MNIRQNRTLPTTFTPFKKGEHRTLVTLLKKGWRSKKVLTLTLDARASSFTWFICVFGVGTQEFPFSIHIKHKGTDTVSRVYVRSVLTDKARIEFAGTSTIGPKAHRADTYLSFRSLLLSPEARAHTIPSLEILAKDVKAGHAASVDRFSTSDLFYLQTRGLKEEAARTLLTRSFLAADLHHLDDTKAKKRASDVISSWVTDTSYENNYATR